MLVHLAKHSSAGKSKTIVSIVSRALDFRVAELAKSFGCEHEITRIYLAKLPKALAASATTVP